MACIHPPELTDDQISDLLDGLAGDDVQAHFKQCPYCRARVEQARLLEQQMHKRLHRWDCPPADTLRDYAFSLLDTSAHQRLAAHVETCPRCREELRLLDDFLVADAAAKVAPAQPARPARRSLPNVWRPQPLQGMPVFAMRGRDSSETIMLETNGVTLFLEAQPEDDGLWLAGRLIAADMAAWEAALVEVWQGDSLQAAAPVRDSAFRCRLRNSEPIDVRISPKAGPSLLIEQVTFEDKPPD